MTDHRKVRIDIHSKKASHFMEAFLCVELMIENSTLPQRVKYRTDHHTRLYVKTI